jgi:hypothetical protein
VAKIAPAQSSSPSQPPAVAASATQTPADQAAERKQKFEEDEQRLENNEGSHVSDSSPGDKHQTIFISPAVVGMVVQQEQRFTLFDDAGHNLTSKAQWSLSNSDIADLVDGPTPTIVAKEDGTVTLKASVGGETSEAQIKVYRDKLPMGAVIWQAPKIPGYTTKHIVQAVPTAH